MATPAITFDTLRRDISRRQLAPIYVLHGEEGYFIDELVRMFDNVLSEEEREFNYYNLYGSSAGAQEAVSRCQGFPMMSDRLMVIVREAQNWDTKDFDIIAKYAAHAMPTTTLVIASRGKTLKSKSLFDAINKAHGVVFEAKKLKDASGVVEQMLRERGLNIEPKGLSMLCDFVGTDVSRLYNQVEKLAVALPAGATVTPEAIEANVGISRDYNNFELKDAVMARDQDKAIRIVEHFRTDPKNFPAIVAVATIFAAFSDLAVYQFLRDKSPSNAMGALGFKWPRQLQGIENASKKYNAWQTIDIIATLRDADRKMKGVGSRQNPYDILRGALFRIFNTSGR